jgi:hypothetical protein
MKVSAYRCGQLALLAVVAYVTTLAWIYPRYFAPFVPFHSDEYQGVNFVAHGMSAAEFLAWPRPVSFLTMFVAGHLGVTGSLICYAAVTLAVLVLAMMLLERYFLRARIPWYVALAAFVLAIAGPGFYFSVGYDIEYSLAALFGLLGIWAWESRSEQRPYLALALYAICCVTSTLSKDSFVPALVVYGVAAAFFRGPLDRPLRAAVLLVPLAAVAISLADAALSHSPFVSLGSAPDSPYFVSFALSSLTASAAFYLSPLFNLAFCVLLAACLAGAWLQHRLGLALALTLVAVLMYAPYFLLPNHWDVCYWWDGMPLLALLVPVGWVSHGGDRRRRLWSRVTIGVALAATLLFFALQSADSEAEQFLLHQQAINANLLAALHGLQGELQHVDRVLVTGVTYRFHPWMNGDFLGPALAYRGTWTVAADPDYGPVPKQKTVAPIAYSAIRWNDYDLILVFDDDGKLLRALTPSEFDAAVARNGLGGRSNENAIAALRNGSLRSSTPPSGIPSGELAQTTEMGIVYPAGIEPFASRASAESHGIYPQEDPKTCCFLAKTATLRLSKPAGARTATFTFFVPDFAPFESANERVSVTFDGIAAGSALLPIGVQEASFAFPSKLVAKSGIEAVLTMSVAYVPKTIGLNADPRLLSVVLVQVEYK